MYKLKPVRQKKDFSKMHETNLMDQHTMRKIQMVYQPQLDNSMKKIAIQDKETARNTLT